MYTFNAIISLSFFFFSISCYYVEDVYKNFIHYLSSSLPHICSSLNFNWDSVPVSHEKCPFQGHQLPCYPTQPAIPSVYLTLQELLSKLTFLSSLNRTFFWPPSYYRPSVLPLSQLLGYFLLVILEVPSGTDFLWKAQDGPGAFSWGKGGSSVLSQKVILKNKRSNLKYIELRADTWVFYLVRLMLPCSVLLILI